VLYYFIRVLILILSKNLFKKSVLRNENTISDKISKSKTLQIDPSCDFVYHNSYSLGGTLNITCGNNVYPIKLTKLITFKGNKLHINPVGEGNLKESCEMCLIKKILGIDNKYQISLFCNYCNDNEYAPGVFYLSIDLRPILTNYFNY